MKRLLFWLALATALSAPALGQLLTGVSQSNSGGGNPVGASCAGTFDLSKGCNVELLN